MNKLILGSEEVPQICEKCLGTSNTNENIRMNEVPNGAACKICTLPYTLYHFKKSHRSADIIKTLICKKCAIQRNVCQCCMLDMKLHISIQLRDKLMSIVSGKETITEEAKNIMMKKFVAMKGGSLGSADLTRNVDSIEDILLNLREKLEGKPLNDENEPISALQNKELGDNPHLKSVDIQPYWDKFPLQETFPNATQIPKGNDSFKSFFIYNIDSSVPEWKISDKITELLGSDSWKTKESIPIIINHKAMCGAFRIGNNELSEKFLQTINNSDNMIRINRSNGLRRGILKVDHFQLFIIPWKQGFSVESFGRTPNESKKIAFALREIIVEEMGGFKDKNDRCKAKEKSKKITKKSKKRVKSIKI